MRIIIHFSYYSLLFFSLSYQFHLLWYHLALRSKHASSASFFQSSSMAPHNKDVGSSSIDDPTDHSSPYFVHPSDGPSSVTVYPVLDGSNYHSWARSMRRTLGGKMKFEFVDGSIRLLMNLILFFVPGIVATCLFTLGL